MTAFNEDYTETKGREGYLAWVAAWKVEYKTLSQAIRDNKQEQRTDIDWEARATLQSQRHYMRCDARDLIELRHEAKEWSMEQRQIALDKAA